MIYRGEKTFVAGVGISAPAYEAAWWAANSHMIDKFMLYC